MVEKKEAVDYVKWLSELSNKDVPIAGGKGASLAEMFNKKFPVPPAFVITAQTYREFVSEIQDEISKILDSTDVDNTKELTTNTKKIRKIIESQPMFSEMEKEIIESYEILGTEKKVKKEIHASKDAMSILKKTKEPIFVAIRSSATTEDLATASFAGQQESFLSIKGNSNVLKKIKQCFSSLYTPRATYYREKRGFEHKNAAVAVVVQKMINSEKSGVMFTSNPLKLNDDVMIEAVFGLGEGIVSGRINPDQYEITRKIEIKEKKIADKKKALVRKSSGDIEEVKLTEDKSQSQVLTKSEIERLTDYGLQIEKHYKHPQDIEFAIENRHIYIVQSRPITTEAKETKALHGDVLLTGLPASPGVGTGKVKIIKNLDDLDRVLKGDILVTEMTNPDMVVTMQKSDAIITDEGGATSHAAIVSREMGIPAVVGTKQATQLLKEGMIVTVDGASGKIYEGEVGEEKKKEILPVVETKTKIKVILDLPDFAERAAKSNVDGVGLLRLEGIIASSGKHPMMFLAENRIQAYTELLQKGIQEIAEKFEIVWIRSSDIRSDEYRNLQGSPKEKEKNPMLGFHGINFSLKHPELLEAEFQAIKNVAEKFPDKKIGIMFPQVISVKQLKEARKIFEKFKKENMQFGTMIETPAACEIIAEICDESDFISFGTNDLTQYTLAIDRGNENLQDLYNEMHSAVLSQIKRVLKICQEKNTETSICGQAGSKKEMVKFLVENGIDSISVNADAAQEISKYVQHLEEQEKPKEELEETIEQEPVMEKTESEVVEEKPEQEPIIEESQSEVVEEKKPEEKPTDELPKLPEEDDGKLKPEETEGVLGKEEFPDVNISFDIFSPQTGEKQAEVSEVDELESVEEKIEDKKEEVEQEREEKVDANEEIEENIETELKKPEEQEQEQELKLEENIETELKKPEEQDIPGFEKKEEPEEKVEEESEDQEDKEVTEVIDEIQGKKDEEDIDIQEAPEEEKLEQEKAENEDKLDIF